MTMPRVIAVSAPPGGGKSTFAEALAQRLNAALVEYDAYDTLTDRPPAEIIAWLAEGGSYEKVDVPELIADLTALREGRPIFDRRTGGELAPRDLIVLETPFGKAHAGMAPLIDTAIFLDTPPDLALARKLRQFIAGNLIDPGPGGHKRFLGWLDRYLLNYEQVVRPAIAIQRQRVLPLADLVIPAADTPLDDMLAAATAFLAIPAGASS